MRDIFRRYLELGTVRRLAHALEECGTHAPRRTTATGKAIGGRPFSRGQLYLILRSRLRLGEIEHQGNVYPGLHPAILDRSGGRAACGNHACKAGSAGKTRYRCYVSKALHHGRANEGLRIPAPQVEALVIERLALAFDDPLALAAVAWLDLPPDRIAEFDRRGKDLAIILRRQSREMVASLIERVEIGEREVTLSCSTSAIAVVFEVGTVAGAPDVIKLVTEGRVRRSGRAVRLVDEGGVVAVARIDPSLIRAILQARRWWYGVKAGQITVGAFAEREGCSASYITRIIRLAFLSPAVVDAVLNGRQPARVDARYLTMRHELAASWRDQEQSLLAAPHQAASAARRALPGRTV